MNNWPEVEMLYRMILKYKLEVKKCKALSDRYIFFLEKWLPPCYEPNRILEERVTLHYG